MYADMSLVRARWTASDGRRGRVERSIPQTMDSAYALVSGPKIARVSILLHRCPAERALPLDRPSGRPSTFDDEHLVAGSDVTQSSWLSAADVIIRRAGSPKSATWSLSELFARFPGCLVAADVHDRGWVVGTATGWRARLVPSRAGEEAAISWYASMLHAWLVADRPVAALQAAHLVVARGADMAWHGGVQISVSRSSRRGPSGSAA